MYRTFLFWCVGTAALLSGNSNGVIGHNIQGVGTQFDPQQSVAFRPIIQAIFSFGSGCPGLKSKVAKMNCSHPSETMSQGIDCTKAVPPGTKLTFTCPNNTVISEKYSSITCGSPAKKKWSGRVVRCKAEVTTTPSTTTLAVVNTTLALEGAVVSEETTPVGGEEITASVDTTLVDTGLPTTLSSSDTNATTISF